MTTDWKALCAELLAWAEKTSSNYYKQADVLLRARAALAEQPVGEGSSRRKRVDIKAILANPVLREEIVEGATDFICKVEGIRPHSLSPAAQSVLDAYSTEADRLDREVSENEMLAAALRAAASKLREAYANEEYVDSPDDWLDSIAAELEAHQ